MSKTFAIQGLGYYTPQRVLTNADLEQIVETNDEWIITRTGIRERHIVAPGEVLTDMALAATNMALANAGLTARDLTHVVVATVTPDSSVPSAGVVLAKKLGLEGVPAFDLNAACSGFVYALEAARGLLALHPEARILVVGGEVLTSRTDWTDRSTCVLFGDGAGVAILAADTPANKGARLLDMMIAADGTYGPLLTIKGGFSGHPYKIGDVVGHENYVQMNGREVYKYAVRNMASICEALLARHGLTTADVDVLIPHQANLRIIEAVGRKLKVPEEKVFVNVDRYGNTSAASIPLALAEARDLGFIKDGQRVLITTFGGGFTWGSALVQF